MSLPYGLLGLLKYQESTGYDLTKMFEDSLNNFWHAQSSQIYRELNRMEEKGWVISRNVIQNNRPNKRVYSITEEGQQAFKAWLAEFDVICENPHDSFLMHLFFGASNQEMALERLKDYRDMLIYALENSVKRIQANIDDYKLSITDGERESLYWQMTLDFGINRAKADINWAEDCIAKLERKQKSENIIDV